MHNMKQVVALQISNFNRKLEKELDVGKQEDFLKEFETYIDTLPVKQTERNNAFILAQPAKLRSGYAANPELNELANEWYLDNAIEKIQELFNKYGVTSVSGKELSDLVKLTM